jgi:signal transduction histidine kinase
VGSFNVITLSALTPEEVPLRAQLNQALVRDLVAKAKDGSIALLGGTFVLWLLVRASTGRLVSALSLVSVGLILIRLACCIYFLRRPAERFRPAHAFWCLTTMYFLSGACISAVAVAAYPTLQPLGILMFAVFMIAFNSMAMVVLAASPLVFLAYLGANMAVPWTVIAFVHPLPGLEHVFQAAVPIYSVTLMIMGRSVHRSLRSGAVLRLQLAASLAQLRETQAQLVEVSRQAGRSDVATAILHNVGNALNSVNVSATLVGDLVRRSKVNNLSKIFAMITEHRADLGRFFAEDRRGQLLPDYFARLDAAIEADKTATLGELQSLVRNVDHIRGIVRSQESHVKPGIAVESFDVHELLDDALELSARTSAHDAIEVVRRFDTLPPARLDRHKVLRIVTQLLANARDAVMTKAVGDRRITVSARRSVEGDLEVTVEDNGCGVDPQDLDRIFRLGFTTKAGGQGIGLHDSACAARELAGNLTARSAGLGVGASFVLVLPVSATAAA